MCDSRLAAEDTHEQASRMSALDLYEDLLINDGKDDGDRVLSMQEILSEKHSLEEQNSSLLRQLIEAKIEARKCREEKASLQKSFDSLLATAKAELERKNSLLGRYLGESGPGISKLSSSSRSRSSKLTDHSSKKKGLLELYKGKRVDEKELTTPKTSASMTPTALLQHRGEKMVGVATRVIGSSFENIKSKNAINLSFNHETDNRLQTGNKNQNTHIQGQRSPLQNDLSRMTATTSHQAVNMTQTFKGQSTQSERAHQRTEVTLVNCAVTSSNYRQPLDTDVPTDHCKQRDSRILTYPDNRAETSQIRSHADDVNSRKSHSASRPTVSSTNSKDSTGRVVSAPQKNTEFDKARSRHNSLTADSKRNSPRAKSISKIDSSANRLSNKDERVKERSWKPARDRRSCGTQIQDRKDVMEGREGHRSGVVPEPQNACGRNVRKKSRDTPERATEVYRSGSEESAKWPHSRDVRDRMGPTSKCKDRVFQKTGKRGEGQGGSRRTDSRKYTTLSNCGEEVIVLRKQLHGDRRDSQRPAKSGRERSNSPKKCSRRMSRENSSPDVRSFSHPNQKTTESHVSIDRKSRSSVSTNKDLSQLSHGPKSTNGLLKHMASKRMKDLKVTSSVQNSSASRTKGIVNEKCLRDDFTCHGISTDMPVPQKKSGNAATENSRLNTDLNAESSNVKSHVQSSTPEPAKHVSTSPKAMLPSEIAEKTMEDSREECEGMDFQPDLELDYDEDSLMSKQIMQQDEPFADHHKEISSNGKKTTKHNNPSIPCKLINRTQTSYSQSPKGKSLTCVAKLSKLPDPLRADLNIGRTSPSQSSSTLEIPEQEGESFATIDVNKLALTPRYQPRVHLIDIRNSPTKSTRKLKMTFLSDTPEDKKRHPEEPPSKRTKCSGLERQTDVRDNENKTREEKTFDRNDDKRRTDKHDQNRDLNVSATCEITHPSKKKFEKAADSNSGKILFSSSSETKHAKKSSELSTLSLPNVESILEESAIVSQSSPGMDVGMEVEIETSPSFAGKAKGKSKKRSKKRTLKVKMKVFKKDRTKSSCKDKDAIQTNRAECCLNSQLKSPENTSKPFAGEHRSIPEPPPVLSQWLDSAKSKKKKKKEIRTKATDKKEKGSRETPVSIKSHSESQAEECLKHKDEDNKQAAMERERVEIANAVASICDSGFKATPSPSKTSSVPCITKSTGGNHMRSYNNAALRWLFRLSLQKLKELDETTNLPLDLSLRKKSIPNKAQDLTSSQHTSAVVSLFSGHSTDGPVAKGVNEEGIPSSSKNITAMPLDGHLGTNNSSDILSADREKKSKEENFDELLKKHSDQQRAVKRKKETSKSNPTPPKTKKPRRVALERVEMPDREPKNDMVSPLSRSLWVSSLEKCQERRKKQARWSSEVSECDGTLHSSCEPSNNNPIIPESEEAVKTPPPNPKVDNLSQLRVEPVLPDSVPTSQIPRPLSKACQIQDSSEATSNSSRFSVGELVADMSSSSWQLSEESKSRFYSFAKAVKVLSPLKLSPNRTVPPTSSTDKSDVRRKVLQSP